MAGVVVVTFHPIPAITGQFRAAQAICGDTGRAWPLPHVELFTTLGAMCGTFRSGAARVGDRGDVYPLPRGLLLVEDDQAGRYRSVERLLTDGEAVDGFWNVDARNVEVKGMVLSDDPGVQRDLLREIGVQSVRHDLKLRHEFGPAASCVHLAKLKEYQRKHVELSGKTLTEVSLRWRAADPTWQEARIRSCRVEMPGNGTFEVEAGRTLESHPQIQVIASDPVHGVGDLRLTCLDDGRWLAYRDPNYLLAGASVIIDCKAGTVTRASGGNALHYASGTFLRLRAGTNRFRYEGGPCLLIFTWNVRWL